MSPETSQHPGSAVRRQRLRRGLTLRELASRVGVSPATVSAVENGRTGLSVARLHQFAAALDVPAAALVQDRETTVAPALPAAPTVAAATGRWRDFAPLPIDGVLAGAIRAFVAVGYHGASMRSIARLAQMSVPGVYHHYPSKQDLLVRILDLAMADLLWRIQQAAAESAEPTRRVALTVEALALFHCRRNDLAFIGASEMRSLEPHNYRRIAALRNQVQELLDAQIASAVAAGPGPEAEAGKAIATMCTSLAQWFHPDGPTTPEEIAAEYARFALRLLGLPAPD